MNFASGVERNPEHLNRTSKMAAKVERPREIPLA